MTRTPSPSIQLMPCVRRGGGLLRVSSRGRGGVPGGARHLHRRDLPSCPCLPAPSPLAGGVRAEACRLRFCSAPDSSGTRSGRRRPLAAGPGYERTCHVRRSSSTWPQPSTRRRDGTVPE